MWSDEELLEKKFLFEFFPAFDVPEIEIRMVYDNSLIQQFDAITDIITSQKTEIYFSGVRENQFSVQSREKLVNVWKMNWLIEKDDIVKYSTKFKKAYQPIK